MFSDAANTLLLMLLGLCVILSWDINKAMCIVRTDRILIIAE
jgi:hypothetical protein